MLKNSSIFKISIFAFLLLTSFELLKADPPNYDPFRNINLDSISPYIPAVVRNCSEICDTNEFKPSNLHAAENVRCNDGSYLEVYWSFDYLRRLNNCTTPPTFDFILITIKVDDNYKLCKRLKWLDSAVVLFTQRTLYNQFKQRHTQANTVGICDTVFRGLNVGCLAAFNGQYVDYAEGVNLTNGQVETSNKTYTTKVVPCDSTCCVIRYAFCNIDDTLNTGFLINGGKRLKFTN